MTTFTIINVCSMRKIYIILVLALLMSSCNKPLLPTGTWYGEVVRTDGQRMSPVALFFHDYNKLDVYCNVVTGNHVYYELKEDDKEGIVHNQDGSTIFRYTYVGDKKPGFGADAIYLKRKMNGEIMSGRSGGYNEVQYTKDSLSAVEFKNNEFKNSPVARSVSQYILGEYSGIIKRKRDQLELSYMKVYAYMDSMIVYCNAMFGKENIRSKIAGFSYDGPIYQAKQFKWSLSPLAGNRIMFSMNGFEAILKYGSEHHESTFFENETAWKNPEFYLSGNVYRGYMHYDPAKQTINFLGDAIAPTIVTVSILNNKELSVKREVEQSYESIGMALFTLLLNSQENVTEYEYTITSNGYIHLKTGNSQSLDLLIGKQGKYLELNTPDGISAKFDKVD